MHELLINMQEMHAEVMISKCWQNEIQALMSFF